MGSYLAEEQNFSKVENKFKLSLLRVEKRFVDLEVIVSELSEKLKEQDLAPVAELKQKVEDIEDLIMVEQAAIIELKNMLEALPKPEVPAVDLSGLESKIAELEKKSLTPMEKVDLQPLVNQIDTLRQQVDQKIQEFLSKVPALDTEVLSSKHDALQKGIGDLQNGKVEFGLKIEGVKKSIEIVENKIGEMATGRVAESLQNNRKDIILIGAKMETIERIIKSMSSDMQQLQLNMGKLDTFERLTLLGKEVESKIERFKIIEDELRRLSSRMEMLYTNMDKRIENAAQAEKKIPEILDSMTNLRKELDKQRLEILDRVKRDDIKNLSRSVEQNAIRASGELEKRYRELLRKTAESDVVKKKDLENFASSIYKELGNKTDLAQTKDLVKKSDLQFFYKTTKDLEGKYSAIDNKLKQLKTDELLQLIQILKKDLDERMGKLQEKEDSLVDEVVRHTEVGIDEMDYRIQSLLDKIIYLETRMVAIEKMLEESRLPIIIE